jgi:hypothetical protein
MLYDAAFDILELFVVSGHDVLSGTVGKSGRHPLRPSQNPSKCSLMGLESCSVSLSAPKRQRSSRRDIIAAARYSMCAAILRRVCVLSYRRHSPRLSFTATTISCSEPR